MILDRIKELLSSDDVLPTITIEITNVCNMRCVHCYLGDRTLKLASQYLELSDIKRIIDDLKELKVLCITLTGGEPLMHPQFFEIAKLFKENNFDVNLMSNITMINEKNIKYIEKYITSITTTLYGFSDKTYNSVTCCDDGYQKYCKARELLLSSTTTLRERGILLAENKCDIMQYIKKDIPMEMHISYSIGSSYIAQHRVDNKTSRCYYYEILKKFGNNSGGTFEVPAYVCNTCLDSLFIKADGNINACANLDLGFGNIRDTSIKSIVQSGFLKKKREMFKFSNFERCIKCDILKYNPLICPGNNQDETGCMFTPSEYSCELCRSVSDAHAIYEKCL